VQRQGQGQGLGKAVAQYARKGMLVSIPYLAVNPLASRQNTCSVVGLPKRLRLQIKDKRFLPVGANTEASSDFHLIAGTNTDLSRAVTQGKFREDLYARLNLWTFSLPGLAARKEDIAPNLDYELDRFAVREGTRITFNKEARDRYLNFATSPDARWLGNFRDLAASVTRMATFSPKGRIDADCVDAEIIRLNRLWSGAGAAEDGLAAVLDADQSAALDPFDRVQLAHVVATCRASRSLSDAGRALFAVSRKQRASANDADRLRKYLARFGLSWAELNS